MLRTPRSLAIVILACSALHTPQCFAHQVPRSEYDRNITVRLRSDGVWITYRLELDQYTLLKLVADPANGFPIRPNDLLTPKSIANAFLARMKEVVPDQVVATLDGQPLAFTATDTKHELHDSAQFTFTLKAPANLAPGRHTFELDDLNFNDKKGRLSIKLEAVEPLVPESLSEIAERRLPGVDNGKQTVTAIVRLPEGAGPAPPIPAIEATVEPPTDFWSLVRRVQDEENLGLLLDTNVGLGLILLIAFLHGVMHSIAPGHGKTMVAAYLVGEQGTPRHAIVLGLIVTLTHTSAAFAVALTLKFLWTDAPPETVQRVLGFGGGLLVAFIGLWLLMQRLAGRSDHTHVGSHSHAHSHSHGGDHGHGHSHGLTPEQFGRVSWARLILLGLAGGIIPCWGAILWVLYCVTAGRYGLAMWTVLAFSVGLAGVLVLIGLSVVWGVRLGRSRGAGRWQATVMKWLPIIGAVSVVAIGLWLCRVNLPR